MLRLARRLDVRSGLRQGHPEQPEGLAQGRQGVIKAPGKPTQPDTQPIDLGAVEIGAGVLEHQTGQILGDVEIAGEILALAPLQLDRERVLVLRAPGIRTQQRGGLEQIAASRRIGGGVLRASAGLRVQLTERVPFRLGP